LILKSKNIIYSLETQHHIDFNYFKQENLY
jgi:hypothetical protein